MKAYVDSREPAKIKENINGRLEMSDIIYEAKELPQADFYLPEHDVAIERKEASDFASSTTDGRLSEQADRMMAEHDHNFLIIENDIKASNMEPYDPKSLYNLKYSDIGDNSIIGMQTSLAVKRDFKIIYTESIDQTIYAVNRIFERFMDEEHESADGGYVKTADTGEVDNTSIAILAQIDGVSLEKAEKIVNHDNFHSIQSLCVDGEYVYYTDVNDWLQEINGVGEVLTQRVIDAFS